MPVNYTFANAATTIPLAQLDSNFATPITLGNTSIQLGNSVSTLNNLTLGNVNITSGNIAFAIPVSGGGTGLSSPGTTGNVLTSNGTAWISTGTAVGSGVASISFGSTGLTPSTATSGTVTVSGTLAAGNGGTGFSSLTANSVLLGNGSSTIQFVSPGASGNVLTSDGTIWSSSAPASGGSGLTLAATLTLVSGTTQYFATSLSSYKSFIIMMGASVFAISTNARFALSSDNGSTYGSDFSFITGGTTGVAGYVEIFKTNESPFSKPFFYVTTSIQSASSYTTVTGIVNAIRITTSQSPTSGVIYIYGMN
jgi:hypothetical protein